MRRFRQVNWQVTAFTSILFASLWLSPANLWSRIEMPQSTIDLTTYVSSASTILRGVVLDVSVTKGTTLPSVADARLQVERWYRGGDGSHAVVHYKTGLHFIGHNCIDFTPGTRWLIFATLRNGHLELVDDCYGAVAVSPLFAPVLPNANMFAQIEADLTAGLADTDRANRLISIQRLGGLKSPLSRPVLHHVIERGDSTEKDWATYAALRTGDTTILSRVRDMFVGGNKDVPRSFLAWELGQLQERSALPGLIDIVETVSDSTARQYAIAALGRMQESEALPAIAAGLADLDPGVRFYALNAMAEITHERACTLSMEPRWTDDMVEPLIRQCLTWWNDIGKRRFTRKQ